MDYTDWIAAGHTPDQFRDMLDAARLNPVYTAESGGKLPTNGEPVSLLESQNTLRDGKAIELLGLVMGKTEPTFTTAKRVEFFCDIGKGTTCKNCPMNHDGYGGKYIKSYAANDDLPRATIDATDDQVRRMLRGDIRAKCSDHLEINVVEKWNVEDLLVTESIESKRSTNASSDIIRQVLNFGTYDTPVNTTVRIVGEQVSSRKDQRGQIFSWLVEPVESSIDKFKVTPHVYKQLSAYQVLPGETVKDRLWAWARDMEHNVTHIFGRPELHVVLQLAFSSALEFNFLGKTINGKLSVAMPGDSRTGKSEVSQRLVDHKRAGIVISGDQASLAGLIGGMQQFGNNNWVISWGVIPRQDRRLVIIDEAGSLADKDIIPAMSSVRSSGIAQIVKIRTASTTARVANVFIFNSPTGQHLAAHADGAMAAIRELFKAHEDIARFDIAIAVGREEVPSEIINARDHGPAPRHIYTSDRENNLTMWGWSRTAEDIRWARGVEDYILAMADKLGRRYTPDFPLIQQENAKEKLAKLAVATAIAVFSTPDGHRVIVRKRHVDFALWLLDRLYSSELMGYLRLSLKNARDESESLGNVDAVREMLAGATAVGDDKKPMMWSSTLEGQRLATGLRSVGSRFEIRTLAEACIVDQDTAAAAMRWLEDLRMIRRVRGGKYMEPVPVLTRLLRELEDQEGRKEER